MRNEGDGYIYWMQRKSGGSIKIGRTIDLTRRLEQIRRKTHWGDLVILQAVWRPDTLLTERSLHRTLRKHRAQNEVYRSHEWFHDCDEVHVWMQKVATGEIPSPTKIDDMLIIKDRVLDKINFHSLCAGMVAIVAVPILFTVALGYLALRVFSVEWGYLFLDYVREYTLLLILLACVILQAITTRSLYRSIEAVESFYHKSLCEAHLVLN